MGLFQKFVSQTRKPEGFLGKLMVGSMNGGHAKLADWGMSHLDGITATCVAELGCGGGRNAAKLLKRFPQAKLTAMDHSDISVQKHKRIDVSFRSKSVLLTKSLGALVLQAFCLCVP